MCSIAQSLAVVLRQVFILCRGKSNWIRSTHLHATFMSVYSSRKVNEIQCLERTNRQVSSSRDFIVIFTLDTAANRVFKVVPCCYLCLVRGRLQAKSFKWAFRRCCVLPAAVSLLGTSKENAAGRYLVSRSSLSSSRRANTRGSLSRRLRRARAISGRHWPENLEFQRGSLHSNFIHDTQSSYFSQLPRRCVSEFSARRYKYQYIKQE